MRVLIIASASRRGGATVSLVNLVKGLAVRDVEVLVTTPEEGYLTDELSRYGIQWRIAPAPFAIMPPSGGLRNALFAIPRFIRRLSQMHLSEIQIEKIAREFKPDIIHTNVSVVETGLKVASRLGIPHIYHIREYGDLDFGMHPIYGMEKRLKDLSERSYAIAVSRDLFRHYGLGDKAKVIYNGIEEHRFQSIPGEPDHLNSHTIVYAGVLTPGKGVDDLVKGFMTFHRDYPLYRLQLLGKCDANFRAELEKMLLAGHDGAKDAVEFAGAVGDVYPRMRRARAVAVPSHREAFGRSTAEAMINGALVVGRDTGGTREQFDNAALHSGFEVSYRFTDPSQLPGILAEIAELDADRYEEMTKAAAKTVRDLYNVDKNVDETLKFYHFVTGRESRKGESI